MNTCWELRSPVPFAAAEDVADRLCAQDDLRWQVWQDLPTRTAWIAGIFATAAEADRAWAALVPLVPEAGAPTGRALAAADWRDSYKAHFHPWRCGRLHWVPTWERDTYALPPGDVALWLDPGLAFGTGNHETTRLCCERLVALAAARARGAGSCRVIDAGCGSGILALSAALLGLGPVVGFDSDPEAVRVSEENAVANGLAGAVEFFVGDLDSGLAGRCGDIVLANIQADVLAAFAPHLLAAVAPGGTLCLSGILAVECAAVRERFAALVPAWWAESRTLGDWSDLAFTRPV